MKTGTQGCYRGVKPLNTIKLAQIDIDRFNILVFNVHIILSRSLII